MSTEITQSELDQLKVMLSPLVGKRFPSLSLPVVSLEAFEPSQIGTIVGALMDALIPHLQDHLPEMPRLGLSKHPGSIGEREGYPDYQHVSGKRLELKLLYVDNPALKMKKPPTPREPSARLTQKVTVKNVVPATDAMLLIAYQMEPRPDDATTASPTIIDLEVLSMIELVGARDKRMIDGGGQWFPIGGYETPTILSKKGRKKKKKGKKLTYTYGRKASEGKDFNEDTNFGKLKRIPHPSLQAFLTKYRLTVGTKKAKKLSEVVEEVEETLDELEDRT